MRRRSDRHADDRRGSRSDGRIAVVNDPGGEISGVGEDHRVASLVVDEIVSRGGRAVASHYGVDVLAEAEAMVDLARSTYARVDVLVNNAGISRQNMIWDMPETDFDQLLATHLKGAWNCLKAVCPTMIEQRHGAVITMSSGVAVIGAVANCGYTGI